jgi:hypothetical protein
VIDIDNKPNAELATYEINRLGDGVLNVRVSMTFEPSTFEDINQGLLKSTEEPIYFHVRDEVKISCIHGDEVCTPYSDWLEDSD